MRYRIGVDLGATNIAAGVLNEAGELLHRLKARTAAARPFEQIAADIAQLARRAAREAEIEEAQVDYVGIGVPGAIDHNRDRIVFSSNLGWRGVSLSEAFRKSWDIPVYIGNDADCAALGEAAARKDERYKNTVMLTLGTGVGGGVIIDGKLYRGGDGFGCEPGHITV
ncbi:MAG: ROK family protein, partial [Oscillospiraceae bacterium]|nr:ROK family protein [Oscillospiraceae bacterium]